MKHKFCVEALHRCTEEVQRGFWEDMRDILSKGGSVEIHFTQVESASRLRKEIYEQLGGYEITIQRMAYTSVHIVVSPQKVRTTAGTTATSVKHGSTGTQEFPEELHRYREVPNSFEPAEEFKVCQVCGERLPKASFGQRGKYRQSYCVDCMRAYGRWRGEVLRTLNLERLTPEVTEGHRKRNEAFRAWFAAHQ